MEIRDSINSFFLSIGFKLIGSDSSEYFGDYYDTYLSVNECIYFRLLSDRSILSIDISNDNLNWYDLALIKILLYDEKRFNKIVTIEENMDFLQAELTNIVALFNKKNYSTTKKRLEEIENERIKQMFAGVKT
ncbi:MAG: hypothetical protein FWC41_13700 [Firmicutes bacterium]|nr:hypothetical protein [Bacillota bacterium]